eukprot:879272-Rhodomonas_salina.1
MVLLPYAPDKGPTQVDGFLYVGDYPLYFWRLPKKGVMDAGQCAACFHAVELMTHNHFFDVVICKLCYSRIMFNWQFDDACVLCCTRS